MTAGFNIRMPSEADLLRYRDEACREVMDANRPRLLSIAKSIQPAVKAALSEIPASTGREDKE